MSTELRGKTIAFLAAPDGVEQVELTEPWKAVGEAGGTPRLISTESGHIQGRDHLEKADTFSVDATVDEVSAADFDALSLPGGVANPDFLRMNAKAVAFVRGFFDAGKPVAAICHAPWTLIEAGVVRGRTLTSWPSLRTDVRNAGGEVFFEVSMSDAWVWDMYRPQRLVKNVKVVTFKDVNVEELAKSDLQIPDGA